MQLGQVRDPRLVRLADGVEGIAQAHQGIRAQLIGQQAGYTPAHGLATYGQRPCDLLAHLGIDLSPLLQQFGLGVGWAFLAVQPPGGHIGELEAQHRNPACRKALGHLLHKVAVHWRAGAMGQDQGGARLSGWPIPQPGPCALPLRVLILVNTRAAAFAHAPLA